MAAPEGLKVFINGNEVEAELGALMQAIGYSSTPAQNRPPLNEWAEYMKERTDILFATGERDGVRWARLSPSTKAGRRLVGNRSTLILQRTGKLRKSIRAKVMRDKEGNTGLGGLSVKVYTQHPLARIHHSGATIKGRMIVPRRARALRFAVGSKVVFARRVYILRKTKIPARPILFISERDHKTAIRYITQHRTKLAREAIAKAKARRKKL
jgi:phage gpG-like protein